AATFAPERSQSGRPARTPTARERAAEVELDCGWTPFCCCVTRKSQMRFVRLAENGSGQMYLNVIASRLKPHMQHYCCSGPLFRASSNLLFGNLKLEHAH